MLKSVVFENETVTIFKKKTSRHKYQFDINFKRQCCWQKHDGIRCGIYITERRNNFFKCDYHFQYLDNIVKHYLEYNPLAKLYYCHHHDKIFNTQYCQKLNLNETILNKAPRFIQNKYYKDGLYQQTNLPPDAIHVILSYLY